MLPHTETYSLTHINTHKSHSLILSLPVDVISKGDLCTLTGEFMRGRCFLMERPAKKLLFFFWKLKESKNKKKRFEKFISISAKDAWYTRSVYLNQAIILSLLADKTELHLVPCCRSLCLSLSQSILSALFLFYSGEVIVSDKYRYSSYSFVYINWLIVTLDVSLSDILIKDLTSEDS